jgi:hypothetical protein
MFDCDEYVLQNPYALLAEYFKPKKSYSKVKSNMTALIKFENLSLNFCVGRIKTNYEEICASK